ncbi:MAG: hypothetical protein QXG32_04185 [Candidatus Bathyarchaeia archaeon]
MVAVKSTVIPGTTEAIAIPMLREISGKEPGPELGVCANPEFLTEIHRS